jgi:hypothetical protein
MLRRRAPRAARHAAAPTCTHSHYRPGTQKYSESLDGGRALRVLIGWTNGLRRVRLEIARSYSQKTAWTADQNSRGSARRPGCIVPFNGCMWPPPRRRRRRARARRPRAGGGARAAAPRRAQYAAALLLCCCSVCTRHHQPCCRCSRSREWRSALHPNHISQLQCGLASRCSSIIIIIISRCCCCCCCRWCGCRSSNR